MRPLDTVLARTTRPVLSRAALSLAGLALVAGGLAGCGAEETDEGVSQTNASAAPSSEDAGAEESPTQSPSESGSPSGSASDLPEDTQAFCAVYAEYAQTFADLGDDQSAPIGATLKEFAEKLQAAGEPADLPEDARRGLELTFDVTADLDDDATAAEIAAQGQQYTAAQQQDSQALISYVGQNCASSLQPSSSPSS